MRITFISLMVAILAMTACTTTKEIVRCNVPTAGQSEAEWIAACKTVFAGATMVSMPSDEWFREAYRNNRP